MIEIKQQWETRITEIANLRTWEEILDHFEKHLWEMENLESVDENERGINKAWSLINLSIIAVKKMGLDFSLDKIDYAKMLERIEAHDKWLEEQALKKEDERKRKLQHEIDDDTD